MLHLVQPMPGAVADPNSSPDVRAGMESARLAAIGHYDILDTAPEPAFDRVTALAADIFSAPIALLGFIGAEQVFFKSRYGLDATQAGRGADPTMPVMTSWLRDEFRNGFHAGVPLHDPDGHEIGTLCVIDRRSRQVDEQQMRRLRALGGVVTDLLAMRLATRSALALVETTSIEVDHRAMNSLQFVASLLQLQSYGAVQPETTQQLRAAIDRVLAVTRVHHAFTAVGSAERVPILAHLRTLCDELSRGFGSSIRLQSEDEVEVPKRQVLPIGLIVNELVGNAHRHAGGQITVDFRAGDDARYRLSVLDAGPGLPMGFAASVPTGKGLGMQIVNALAAQLGGALAAGANPAGRGSCFTLTFPVA